MIHLTRIIAITNHISLKESVELDRHFPKYEEVHNPEEESDDRKTQNNSPERKLDIAVIYLLFPIAFRIQNQPNEVSDP